MARWKCAGCGHDVPCDILHVCSPRKIAAIDNKTIYDIPHKLRELADQIERGEHSAVKDAVVIVRREHDGGLTTTQEGFHFGTGNSDTSIAMVSLMAHKLLRTE